MARDVNGQALRVPNSFQRCRDGFLCESEDS